MKEEKVLSARFAWWRKTTIVISVLGLTIFCLIRFVHGERLIEPRAVRIEPTFGEGEERRYKISRTITSVVEGMEGMEGFKTETPSTAILSLRVVRACKEGGGEFGHPEGIRNHR